jgi:peptide/nickel transport system substrate-binding protein
MTVDLDPSNAQDAVRAGMTRRQVMQGAVLGTAAIASQGILSACGGGSSSPTGAAASGGTPQRGGKLVVGLIGGGAQETMDPGLVLSDIDGARTRSIFDPLVEAKPNLDLEPALATHWEANSAGDVWTIQLRPDVVWHDGSPFTADDVIYTLKRNASNAKLDGHSTVAPIDVNAISKPDKLTVRLPLHMPVANLMDSYFQHFMSIVKDGETNFSHPIGTGPFKFKSWTPGTSSLFERNSHYWQPDLPYVDSLELQSIPDSGARLNALISNEIDAMGTITFSQAKNQVAPQGLTVLKGDGPVFVPFTMAVDLDPFRDVRVRQAMRLIAGRPQLIETAQLGFGSVGNDLACKGIQFYNNSLAERDQDIDQAKSLLKAAGASDLTVTLYSSNYQPGQLESATAFAEQAKQAGVTINVDNGPASSYFSVHYLKAPFMQSVWNPSPLYTWMVSAVTSNAPFNETHWKVPAFDKLVQEAGAEVDQGKAADIWNHAQEMLWNDGGYLIWGFQPWLDALGPKVRGAVGSYAGALGYWNFRHWWLAS